MNARNRFARGLVAVIAMAFAGIAVAQGDAYPSKALKMIVPYPPGGAADLTGRLLAQKMSESMKQPVVVENRPGANGGIGAEAVAKSAPDGYTLLVADRGALAINPSIYQKLPYDPLKDFADIGVATEAPYVLVAHPSLNASTVREFIAVAKAKPGSIAYGSYGIGSMPQLNFEAMSRNVGIELLHVPYKGSSPAVQAVVAGEVGVTISSAPAILGFMKDGRLRVLAIGADKRLPLLPDVPTLAEAGVKGDLLVPVYFAVAAAAGTPPAIVARLNDEMRRALTAPDVVEKLTANGLVPVASSPQAMAALVAQDVAKFAALVKTIGIKPE